MSPGVYFINNSECENFIVLGNVLEGRYDIISRGMELQIWREKTIFIEKGLCQDGDNGCNGDKVDGYGICCRH